MSRLPYQHRRLAYQMLGLIIYALVYTGAHQISNPAIAVEECDLVDHHLHQDPHKHSCNLCDYHLNIEFVYSDFRLASHFVELQVSPKLPADDFSCQFNLSPLRGPPAS